VQPLGDLLGVAFVVELQEAGEDFPASGLADREPSALLGLVEAVVEVEVVPAVGGGDGLVHLDVERSRVAARILGIMSRKFGSVISIPWPSSENVFNCVSLLTPTSESPRRMA
jgi:hypothetical protein